MAQPYTDPDPTAPRPERALLALAGGVLWFALARTIVDPDLWGHVLFGLDLIRTGRIVRPDTYSYLSGSSPWINHEWLAEALFGLAYRAGGASGLVLLKLAVGLTALGLVLAHLLRRGLGTLHAVLLLLLGFALATVGTNTVRPQIFTFLGLVLLLLALDAADHGRARWLGTVPFVMAGWVNLHGGFLAGAALLLLWGGVHVAAAAIRRRRGAPHLPPGLPAVGAAIAGGLLGTLLNPYGVRLWSFLLETATVARPEISEWAQTPLATWEGGCYLILLAGCAYAMLTRGRSPALPGLAIFLVLAFGAVTAVRHLPLFGLAAPILAADAVAALSQRRGAAGGGARSPRFAPLLLLLTAALVALSIPWLRGPRIEAAAQEFPARAVGVLRESGVGGNLAVHFDWGEYAIWHLAPALEVSVDGRRETVYSEEIYQANIQFIFGVGDWDRLLDDHPTDLVLIPRHLPVYNLLRLKPGWSPAYEDDVAAIFARDRSPLGARIRATPAPDLPPDGDQLVFPVAAPRVR